MKYLKKLATVLCSAFVAVAMLSSCEGSELFDVNSPNWLEERIDSIKKAKENSIEDLYSIGATNYSTGWWQEFSHYYIIPDGAKWTETFNLHIDPNAPNTYKNFALLLTNDEPREIDGEGDQKVANPNYKEYGAIRFDNQPSGNSEWGTIDRSCIESNLTFETDVDPGVQRLGGIVTLTVDRSAENAFYVEMNNGDVKKTYTLPRALDNLNKDTENENIRCFLVVEGSYIDFLTCEIKQIRTTKTPDQQPVSMVLNRVPKKVLLEEGMDLKNAFANVTATVTYDGEGQREIPASELEFVTVPDFNTLGEKTIVAIYNKTYKEQNADKAITVTCKTKIVDTLSDYVCVGDPKNTTGFLGAFTDLVKIAPNETHVVKFTNYTSGGGNWNNFVVDFTNGAGERVGVARADCWCMDPNFAEWPGVIRTGYPADWGVWLADMEGAKVTLAITNNGDGTASMGIDMVAENGNKYRFDYTNLNGLNPNDMYFRLSVDNSHIEFDNMIGNDNNTSGFLSAFSDTFNVPSGKTVTTQFTNYTSGGGNWNNFVVDMIDGAENRVGVARADCWCMDPNFAEWPGAIRTGYPADWGVWLADMDGAQVNLAVTNNGDGTVAMKINMTATNGNKYCFDYTNLSGINPDDCNFRLSIDNSHFIFGLPLQSTTAAKRAVTRSRK